MLDDKLIQEIIDYLDGHLDKSAQDQLRTKLDHLGYDLNELNDLQKLQYQLSQLPTWQPSDALSRSFYQKLDARKSLSLKNWLYKLEIKRRLPQFAYAALLLMCGWLSGYFMSDKQSSANQLALLTTEVRQMKQMVSLTLIHHPSPVERLKGINKLALASLNEQEVVDALLKSLNTDRNTNLRLAAIDALGSFIERAHVRQGLIQAIPLQKSPLVQLALAEMLADAGEKAARQPIEILLLRTDLNIFLRRGLERNLNKLI